MTNKRNCGNTENKELTKAQLNFLEYCEKFGWGTLEVTVKNGEPVMVSPIKQDFKMTDS